MPRGDKTGPDGFDPGTGRGLGYCAGFDAPGFTKSRYDAYGRGFSRRFGRGVGRGFGYRTMPYPEKVQPAYANVSEKTILENDIRVLKEQLTSLENRLIELQQEKS